MKFEKYLQTQNKYDFDYEAFKNKNMFDLENKMAALDTKRAPLSKHIGLVMAFSLVAVLFALSFSFKGVMGLPSLDKNNLPLNNLLKDSLKKNGIEYIPTISIDTENSSNNLKDALSNPYLGYNIEERVCNLNNIMISFYIAYDNYLIKNAVIEYNIFDKYGQPLFSDDYHTLCNVKNYLASYSLNYSYDLKDEKTGILKVSFCEPSYYITTNIPSPSFKEGVIKFRFKTDNNMILSDTTNLFFTTDSASEKIYFSSMSIVDASNYAKSL